jgi:hypothetical protein
MTRRTTIISWSIGFLTWADQTTAQGLDAVQRPRFPVVAKRVAELYRTVQTRSKPVGRFGVPEPPSSMPFLPTLQNLPCAFEYRNGASAK